MIRLSTEAMPGLNMGEEGNDPHISSLLIENILIQNFALVGPAQVVGQKNHDVRLLLRLALATFFRSRWRDRS
jgi:hypothetical protein